MHVYFLSVKYITIVETMANIYNPFPSGIGSRQAYLEVQYNID